MATFNFTVTKYQLESSRGSGITSIRVYAARNSQLNPTTVSGSITIPGSANARYGGRKRLGIHARGVSCTKATGTAPNIRIDRAFIPIYNPADAASAAIGTSITSGPLTGFVVKRAVPEVVV